MTNKDLANFLFPNVPSFKQYENKYPKRNLDNKAMVTRFAPSPTGFVHMGSLYTAFINAIYAKQTGGIFYLRIEDTDQKRMVSNGIEGILKDLALYDFNPDEDPIKGGMYGSYIQSDRKDIYLSYVKYLVEEGLAYPCFCTEEELESIRKKQEDMKVLIGYYGSWAKYRDVSNTEKVERIKAGEKYVIRLKSPGNYENKVTIVDAIKGKIEFPENIMDIVLLKSDGLPTYHLAHVIDDHLMHTTHVIRGDEWLSSLPIHIQLFKLFNFEIPTYAHLAPLTKKVGDKGVRKLSKRYDPECSITYYDEAGIPKEAVKRYLATIINSNFEEWYTKNPEAAITEFTFTFDKMAIGGSLFDLQKLESISKLYFGSLSAVEIYNETLNYMQKYNKEFGNLLKKYKDYSIAILDIERNTPRPRRDIAKYPDVIKYHGYMYDEIFFKENPYTNIETKAYDLDVLKEYIDIYNEDDDEDVWMHKLKDMAIKMGYAADLKSYKKDPSLYKGNMRDICEVIRLAITGEYQTPNLYYLLKLLGKERIIKRFQLFLDYQTK